MVRVWLMWEAKKSSNRVLAPGTKLVGVRAGSFCMQRTASLYALRSVVLSDPLLHEKKS